MNVQKIPVGAAGSIQEEPNIPSPLVRSYSWALSGDFTAKLDLLGEAQAEEDIDALNDYVKATINALKRSLKARLGVQTKDEIYDEGSTRAMPEE